MFPSHPATLLTPVCGQEMTQCAVNLLLQKTNLFSKTDVILII